MMRIFIIQVHDPVFHLEVDEEQFKHKKRHNVVIGEENYIIHVLHRVRTDFPRRIV